MEIASFLIEANAAYNLPALLVLALVIGSCCCGLLYLAIVKLTSDTDGSDGTDIVDHGDVWCANLHASLHASLRAASRSVLSALQAVASAFSRQRSPFERYELRSRRFLSTSARAISSPDQFHVRLPVYSMEDSMTGSGASTTCHPNSPNDSWRSMSPVQTEDGVTEAVENSSVLDLGGLPWVAFVAPWHLIAASATPRVSSDLEVATGHSEGHRSIDVVDAQV